MCPLWCKDYSRARCRSTPATPELGSRGMKARSSGASSATQEVEGGGGEGEGEGGEKEGGGGGANGARLLAAL